MIENLQDRRKLVFISHAFPEENEFTRWIGLQLAKQGYWVWSDVTKLIGGEKIWQEIEDAIRHHAVKFLFVFSKSSNDQNRSTYKELLIADTVAKMNKFKDFIIPLRVDDVVHNDMNILIHGITTIEFTNGWAKGLSNVLKKLTIDKVPKDIQLYNSSLINGWWREQYYDTTKGIENKEEEYLTNWHKTTLPGTLYFWKINENDIQNDTFSLSWPSIRYKNYIVSFANKRDLSYQAKEAIAFDKKGHFSVLTDDIITGVNLPLEMRRYDVNVILKYLMIASWEKHLQSLKLAKYYMSNKKMAFCFNKESFSSPYYILEGRSGKIRRQLIGYKTIDKKNEKLRHWHFGVSVKPLIFPVIGYAVSTHVGFSDDGYHLWLDPKKMHRARRGQCKDWWNDDWRDRLLCAMDYIRDNNAKILLPAGEGVFIETESWPISLISPVSYREPRSGQVMSEAETTADDLTDDITETEEMDD